jgi:hypothetical protein
MQSSNPRGAHVRIAFEWIARLEARRRNRGDRRPVANADRFRDPAGYVYRTSLPVLAAAVVDGDAGVSVDQAVDDLARVWALELTKPEDAAEAVEEVRPILSARTSAGSQAHGDSGERVNGSRERRSHDGTVTGDATDRVIDARIAALAARVAAAVAVRRDEMRSLPGREAARLRCMEERTRCHSGRRSAR